MNRDSSRDERCMQRALRLAVKGVRSSVPNPAVGCLIVKAGKVVGEGFHARRGGPHAEVVALREAGHLARDATLYVTLEPCSHQGYTPPCAPALVAAGISRVVVAARDPNPRVAGGGLEIMRQAGIEVTVGVCESQARFLNRGFFSRFERGRPWLVLKLATSLDGRSALADGTSRWITGPISRAAVHRGRARAGAVMTGVGTVLADDPALSVRLPGQHRQPLRVVLDTHLSVPPRARLFAAQGGPVHVFCSEQADIRRRDTLTAAGASIHCVTVGTDGRLRLDAVLEHLAELEINMVYAECGPRLAGALIGAGLVDELELFQGPHLLGMDACACIMIRGTGRIPAPPHWRIASARRCGRDVRIKLLPEAG